MTKINEADVVGNTGDNDVAQTNLLSTSNISIVDIFKKINPKDKNFLKYIPDEFLNAEQKKAKVYALDIEAEKYSTDDKKRIAKNKRTIYNEFNTIAMRWAYSNNTNIGDSNILNRNGREYVLIEATEDGNIELASGNYESVRYEYERIHEQENDSLYEHIEKIRSQQRPNMWNIKYDERRTNGSGNSEYFGREEFQDNTTGNNEHLRTGNKNTSKQIKKSLDVDSEGTTLSVEQIKRYKNVAPELRDEQGRITQFRVNGKPITEYWYTLSAKQKQELTQKIKQVTFDDDYKTIILKPGNEFELIKNNDAEPLTNVGGTTKSGVSTTIGSASINNIPQNAEKTIPKNHLT